MASLHQPTNAAMPPQGFVPDNPDSDDREAEAEIRSLFAEWFAASRRRDIDASMAPIAGDVVSYEHDTPLQYVGADAVRAVCQRGFDLTEGDFDWSIPDLQVMVRGNLAVTWGLNRMHSEAGGTTTDLWSRGTRVFLRRDGRWQMVHQHVSFPTGEDGRSVMDLAPEPSPTASARSA